MVRYLLCFINYNIKYYLCYMVVVYMIIVRKCKLKMVINGGGGGVVVDNLKINFCKI